MITQPPLPRKVCLLAWSGWLGLLSGCLWAQQPPYVFTSEEVHVRGLRVTEIGDTVALRPSEWESLLPRTWKAYRQWTHDGVDAATEWILEDHPEPWQSPLEALRWGPEGVSYRYRGNWHPAPANPETTSDVAPHPVFSHKFFPLPKSAWFSETAWLYSETAWCAGTSNFCTALGHKKRAPFPGPFKHTRQNSHVSYYFLSPMAKA